MALLEKVNRPQDLRQFDLTELEELAQEIRGILIETCAKNGGHIAPNLGVVELSLALHYVFDAPKDKLIWDCSHQAYIHKMVTGRRERISTIRKHGGLSGFCERRESEYDAFGAGHTATAISAATGFAVSRDLHKQDNYVVSIVGDGSITGGMAFEGLNHAGHLKPKKFLIILNDNRLSYMPTIGGLAAYTNRLAVANRIYDAPVYHQVRADIHYLMEHLPKDDEKGHTAVRRLREAALHVLEPGIVFEELGYTYLGPVDGHNVGLLIDTLKKAKEIDGPVFIHVLTTKGKGFEVAEKDQLGKWHGVGPYDAESGEFIKKAGGPAWTEVFGRHLVELAKRDPKVVGITAAMPLGTGLKHLLDAFPERYFDVGIAEQHGVTFAAGLAADGMKPVAAIYSTFVQRAFDQVIHDVGVQNLHVTLAMDRGGLVEDSPTHHGVFDIAYLRPIPNFVVMAPKSGSELKAMMDFALEHEGPIAYRYPRGEAWQPEAEVTPIKLGKAETVARYGTDAAIFAYGHMTKDALEAAAELEKQGVNVTVVNARFCKPLDVQLLSKVASECGYVLTVEEGQRMGGFGSAVLEMLAENGREDVTVSVHGIPDHFIEHGDPKIHKAHMGLDPAGITARVHALLREENLDTAAVPVPANGNGKAAKRD